jgi:ribonucleoside-diphosphate reductase alpha chain
MAIFNDRYAMRNEQREITETPSEAVIRISNCAALAEEAEERQHWANQFAEVIDSRDFVPSTPIWANMGKPDRPWQPGACFVLDVEDSLESMYQTLKDSALVCKSGGGLGYNFSKIRPKGDLVHSTKGQASGVVELIKLYDSSAGMIKQGGVRRGAFMGILNCDHPEILDFIQVKLQGGIENFNLSVGISDEFMQAISNDDSWEFRFMGEGRGSLPARQLWNEIIGASWSCGDPGVIFLDRLTETNPVPGNQINSTNPCGEQPLSPGESCLLGSINLVNMVDGEQVDWDKLTHTTVTAVRFLDNLIDVGAYPMEFIALHTRNTRKVGLGVLGLHDLLIKCGRAYASPEGRQLASQVLKHIQQKAHLASEDLGAEKAVFPQWEESVFAETGQKRRNAACITIAPTGSITVLAGAEGYGIEPIFAVAYRKTTQAGVFDVFSPLFQESCEKAGVSKKAMVEVAKKGSCQGIEGIPQSIQQLFKGAQDIHPKDHLEMQIILQHSVDNAISKTINLPNSATMEDIGEIYAAAWRGNLKGITVFRDGSKQGVIEVGEKKSKKDSHLGYGQIKPRPKRTLGVTERLDTGCGKVYLTVNYDPENGEVIETFITTGSDGGCLVYTEATSRLVSMAIRAGVPIPDIVEQLKSTHSCPSWMLAKGKGRQLSPGKSCASSIGTAMEKVIRENGFKMKVSGGADSLVGVVCPECDKVLMPLEGCYTCSNCGYSKC